MGACGCNNYSTSAATVPISAKNKIQYIEEAKARKKIKGVVQYPAKNEVKNQKAVQVSAWKTGKKTIRAPLDEPYQDIPAFPETGKALLFKNKGYKDFLCIEINFLRKRPVRCMLRLKQLGFSYEPTFRTLAEPTVFANPAHRKSEVRLTID